VEGRCFGGRETKFREINGGGGQIASLERVRIVVCMLKTSAVNMVYR
jgi:hypothetical protein